MLLILLIVIFITTATTSTQLPLLYRKHTRPNPVLTLAIAECLRKPSRPWHAPAVLHLMSAQATGSAHQLKKEEQKQNLVRIAADRSIPRACAGRGCQPTACAADGSSVQAIVAPQERSRTNHRQWPNQANQRHELRPS
jgi:hypothetical protein